ncbi:unnamed protein product [Rhizophagus irregularis]|nr:unnamed protein product [Rhizophagus irregularis]
MITRIWQWRHICTVSCWKTFRINSLSQECLTMTAYQMMLQSVYYIKQQIEIENSWQNKIPITFSKWMVRILPIKNI